MAQVLGLVQVNWRGANVPVEKGSKVKLGGLMQKSVITGQQTDFAQDYGSSEITATTKLTQGMSVQALFAPGSGPLIVTCDTGQTYSFPDAFLSELAEFTAGDGGKIPLKWMASAPTEVIASQA